MLPDPVLAVYNGITVVRDDPPFPSCSNYDATAWRFVKAYARQGALFWNVA